MYEYERKYVPTYVTYLCIVLMVSLLGNIWQMNAIHQLKEMDIEDAKSYELLSQEYNALENKYEILCEEYNDLYESTK